MNLVGMVGLIVYFIYVVKTGKSRTIDDISNPHRRIIDRYYFRRIGWKTSNLGAILYKNKPENPKRTSKRKFTILIYKYFHDFTKRHLTDHENNRYDPLKNCPVQNCVIKKGDEYLHTADAVIVYLFRGRLPRKYNRNPNQLWVFLSDESPVNTFAGMKNNKPSFSSLAYKFNWSMTYRSDSDVPIPYGRTIPLRKPVFPNKWNLTYTDIASLVPYWNIKRRDVLVNVLMSHCRTHRINYIKFLERFIDIHFYGKCSHTHKFRKRCPGHFREDCNVTQEYLFYLVLENTSCRQYMTEKVFYNAYLKGAIPIIRHPSLEDCVKLLPPNSFIHVEQFNTAEEMVTLIKAMGKDEELLLSFHVWRNHFYVTNEHGFFKSQSYQMCRLCQALNYNDRSPMTYDEDDIRLFLDPKLLCSPIGDYVLPPTTKKLVLDRYGRRKH